MQQVDLFDSTYENFAAEVLSRVRALAFGVDIGQNSWLTVDEHERFRAWLELGVDAHVLEVASGAGGPALHLARASGCRVTGIDCNAHGVATSARLAAEAGLAGRVRFEQVDADGPLPFAEGAFDALVCIDSFNHLTERLPTLREWRRVLRPGGRALFTDPVVLSGPVTNEELAVRSSVGRFLFVPPGVNEALVERAELRLLRREDVSANAALVAGRWRDARERYRAELERIEGEERFAGLQRFFATVHALTGEGRLARIAYLVERPRA